jgi:hypothetical protein
MLGLLLLSTYFTASDPSRERIPSPFYRGDEDLHSSLAASLSPFAVMSDEDAAEIGRLVQQLSSSSFAEREAAKQRLETIGDPAVPALRAAAGKGADLEMRLRSERLLSEIFTKDFPQRFGESLTTVEKILPRGWSITRTVSGSTPPDWWTNDPKAGFLVEAHNGEEVVQLWYLPLDWIGIRKVRNRAWHSVYGPGILRSSQGKIIVYVSDEKLHERLYHVLGGSFRLVNGGYDEALRIFAGKLDRADRIATALVRKYCRRPEQFRAAIDSLNDLGVPARNLFLRSARKARGQHRSDYTSLLGLIGGKEAIDLLCDTATDLQVSANERKYAILALRRHEDKRIGRTLHAALKQMPDGEGLDCVVKQLTHRRYKPAESDLLALFKHLPNDAYAKHALVQALAAFRCNEAIPELRGLRQELADDPKKHEGMLASLDMALLRMTGDWGEPGGGARLFVVAPKQPRLGEKMELTVHLENSGLEPIELLPLPRAIGLHVDGKAVLKQEIFLISGLVTRIDPGEVWTFSCDLSPYIKMPGRHQAQYWSHGACSNVIAFTVQAASGGIGK